MKPKARLIPTLTVVLATSHPSHKESVSDFIAKRVLLSGRNLKSLDRMSNSDSDYASDHSDVKGYCRCIMKHEAYNVDELELDIGDIVR